MARDETTLTMAAKDPTPIERRVARHAASDGAVILAVDNVARWTISGNNTTVNLMRLALLAHDEWQRNIAADTSDAPHATKVIRNRPSTLRSQCWDDAGVAREHPLDPAMPSDCATLYPFKEDPRVAAGGRLSGDVLKCQLKAISTSDYAVTFSSAEWTRLRMIFPGGACDWSRPGVGQGPLKDTWLAFPKPGHAVRLDRGSGGDDDRSEDHHGR
jgi:hypothetical protein